MTEYYDIDISCMSFDERLELAKERLREMRDQEAKNDAGKLQLSLVPRQIIKDIAEVRMYGNVKYGSPENWRDVEPERYRDALLRHLLEYLDDPHAVDKESGIRHLKHIACNVAFLCELEKDDPEASA